MNFHMHAALFGVVVITANALAATSAVADAAKKFYANADWQPKSVLEGDFSCRKKKDVAILGTSKDEIVVAIFLNGIEKKPELLKYPTGVRDPQLATLTTESMDFDIKEFEREVGSVPGGLEPSKSCLGLNMGDGMVDSAHIYWHRRDRRFYDWSR